MNNQTPVNDSAESLICSEGVEYLCNRFRLSPATAQEIVDGNWSDGGRMEQEAERLANYEKLYRRMDRRNERSGNDRHSGSSSNGSGGH
jgi:hypothetical protein